MDSARPLIRNADGCRARTVGPTTGALAGLSFASLILVWWLGAGTALVTIWAVTAAGYFVSLTMIRFGNIAAGAWLAFTLMLAQYVEAGLIGAKLGAASTTSHACLLAVPLLFGSVALPARSQAIVLAATAVTLGITGWVLGFERLTRIDQIAGLALALVLFAVSWYRIQIDNRALETTLDNPSNSGAPVPHDADQSHHYLLTEHADDLCALVDKRIMPLYMNPAYARVFGQPLEELMQTALDRYAVPDSQEDFRRAVTEALEHGRGTAEVNLSGKDGIVGTFDMKARRVPSADGPLLALICRDVTERRRLQQRLMATERMESLARLAGSVAHDFNNLLMVIGGAGEMARHALKDNPEAIEDLDSVLDATHNAAKLTRQLLSFSRKQVVTVTELDLAENLHSIRELLERLVGNKVKLVFDFQPCPKVMMAAAQLEQLAMDLAMNARDAMPNGGTLTFSLGRFEVAPGTASLAAGPYAELTVLDEGTGIPDAIRPHIFEPLFTTKGDAGTGLGLPTCLNIVSEARGSISVESRPNRGTTFRIRLPSSALSSVRPSQRPSPVPAPILRVLVVDDEPAPRETAARMLRASGFEVVVASSFDQARRCIEDPELELDALLTDVMLRGELGTDLLEDCRRRRPKIRIVVMSGYSPNPEASRKVLAVSAKFLPKPFTREALIRALGGEPSA